jgi:predicted MPP superfamily phosphohydrolase
MIDNTSFKLRLLHLSDLHERGSREGESWRRRRVLGDAWLRNLDELKVTGPFDLVCFTGDTADWGLADEYAAVTGFFQETLQRLGVPPERFFLVPGNHDVCRKVATDDWQALRANLHRVNDQDLSRWLAGGTTPWGFQDAQRDAVLTRQTAYRDWLRNDLKRPELLPDPALHPHLGYRQTMRLPGFPFDVHVIGLDSAWLAGDDHDASKLRLTEDQAMRLATDMRGEPLDGFRLALIHHPLTELADGTYCQRLLADRVDLLLRGHLHEPEPTEWADPDRRLRQVAAGCLYEGHGADRYPNACEVVEITLDARGRPLRYELWFRGWSGRGFWFDDNSLYRGTQNGRLTWWMQSPPAPSTVHPRVEDVFAGRQAELQRLEQVLLRANGGARTVAVCSVQGMAGVGKSYLVDRFYARHAADFPGGYLRLVLDPRQPLEAETLLGRLRDLLQLPASTGGDAMLCARLRQPLTLMHIENADSWETARAVAQAVQRLADCPMAVSGRFQHLGESANWSRIPLRPFEEDAALDQLRQELEKAATAQDYGELVRALGYLPLAIHLAAGHLRAGRSVAGFLGSLRKKGLCLDHPDPADPNRLLSATFELSLDLLRESLGADADRWLPAFYALGHGPIGGFGASLGAALAGLSATDFEELAVQAHALSLLDRTPEGESWRLHPLLVDLLRPRSEEAAVLERMTKWFLKRLSVGYSQEVEQLRHKKELLQEKDALKDWIGRLSEVDLVRVEQAYSWLVLDNIHFYIWLDFFRFSLKPEYPIDQKLNVLRNADYMVIHSILSVYEINIGFNFTLRGSLTESTVQYLDDALEKLEAIQRQAARELCYCGKLDEALRILLEHVMTEKPSHVRGRAVTLEMIADLLQILGEWNEALRIRYTQVWPVHSLYRNDRTISLGKIALNFLARGSKGDRNRALQTLECVVQNDRQYTTFRKIC